MYLFPPLSQGSRTDTSHTPDDRQPQADTNEFVGMLKILQIGKGDQEQNPLYQASANALDWLEDLTPAAIDIV